MEGAIGGGGGPPDVVSSFPPPPRYFKLFEKSDDPLSPASPIEGEYQMFGELYTTENVQPSLVVESTQLFPLNNESVDLKAEFQTLNKSLLFNYLELLDSLVQRYRQFCTPKEAQEMFNYYKAYQEAKFKVEEDMFFKHINTRKEQIQEQMATATSNAKLFLQQQLDAVFQEQQQVQERFNARRHEFEMTLHHDLIAGKVPLFRLKILNLERILWHMNQLLNQHRPQQARIMISDIMQEQITRQKITIDSITSEIQKANAILNETHKRATTELSSGHKSEDSQLLQKGNSMRDSLNGGNSGSIEVKQTEVPLRGKTAYQSALSSLQAELDSITDNGDSESDDEELPESNLQKQAVDDDGDVMM